MGKGARYLAKPVAFVYIKQLVMETHCPRGGTLIAPGSVCPLS